MYSLVLMTAMTSAPDTGSFNGYFRDLFNSGGCNGCSGCCGGCSGMSQSSSGCCGGGCCGGGFLGFGLFSRSNSPSGCCGGCSGISYGCTGASYSCSGGSSYSCSGGYGCSAMPGYSGPLPSVPMPNFNTQPSSPYYPPAPGTPGIPYSQPEVAPPPLDLNRTGQRPGTMGIAASNVQGSRGTVVIRLPVDARLTADGTALRLTGAERRFVTPELPAGQDFVYRFKVDYDRDGEVVSVTKKVPVRAGGTVMVEFVDLTASKPALSSTAAATVSKPSTPVLVPPPADQPSPGIIPSAAPSSNGERATITVKLPAGASLFVDDRKSASADPVREFTTPPLSAGKDYAYLMKAEVIRDGRPEYLIQKVPFRAGEKVTVDFTTLGNR